MGLDTLSSALGAFPSRQSRALAAAAHSAALQALLRVGARQELQELGISADPSPSPVRIHSGALNRVHPRRRSACPLIDLLPFPTAFLL